MRFKKGEKVEVMCDKEVPVSWHRAEVVCSSDHTYHVHYNSCPRVTDSQMVEKVLSKYVRPCPPFVQGLDSCTVGDIVEVFYESSWKVAAILQIMEGKEGNKRNKIYSRAVHKYLVRLFGKYSELVVDRWNIRIRQAWHDGKWILMGKNSQLSKDLLARKPSASNHYKKINSQVPQFGMRAKRYYADIWDDVALGQFPGASSRSLKRSSRYCSSIVEEHKERAQKLRAIEKEGCEGEAVAAPVHEKVDDVAYPEKNLIRRNLDVSLNIMSNGNNQIKKAYQNDIFGHYLVRRSELNKSDSDACSVGSCSVTKQSSKNIYSHFTPKYGQEANTLCSDAESSYGSGSERESSSVPPKEGFEVSIRKLELHAYRNTLEALYASGPLSWDQEAMLTNLRIMLHVSNDEHLQELKHLISPKTAIIV